MGIIRVPGDEFRKHAERKARERGDLPASQPGQDMSLKDMGALQQYLTIVDDTKPGWQEPATPRKIRKTTYDAIQKAIGNTPGIIGSAGRVTAGMGMDDWPEQNVWSILWNAMEREVRDRPAYHVALLKKAQTFIGSQVNVVVTTTEPPKPGEGPERPKGPRPGKSPR